ncbi:MAG: hypothetical protein E3J66_04080 [Dehalococcoidia bacterium]|nr:MAG: hypothetical protein E3J66_04080 [Dehalococcoidia bacterium]
MKKKEDPEIPEFQSLEEEKEYWEARGPLAEGHKGKINRSKTGQKRSSYLAVRLTGEELTELRDTAARYGIGPSTFARLLLTSAIGKQRNLAKRILTFGELKDMFLDSLPQDVKDNLVKLVDEASIGETQSILLLDSGNIRQAEELTWQMLVAFLRTLGFQVVTAGQEKHKEIESNRRARI